MDKNETNCAPNRESLTKPKPADTRDEKTDHDRKKNSRNADGIHEPTGNNWTRVILGIKDTLRPVGMHTVASE